MTNIIGTDLDEHKPSIPKQNAEEFTISDLEITLLIQMQMMY